MKEYIEREAVEKMLEDAQLISDGEYCGYCTEDINLSSIPAADVAPVRHGRWESNGPDDIVVYCSQCMMPQDAPSNYCPSCGALMDKEDEHD